MAVSGTTLASPPAGDGPSSRPDPAARRLGRRRTLPGSRAVVGGLLVTASAVGLFAAYGASQDGPAVSYVVVADDIPVGHVFRAADLEVVPIDLPDGQRAVSFTDPGELVGTIAMSRLLEGQLVQSGDVAHFEQRRGLAQLSVPVDPANALNGEVVGELVDVIVTYTAGGRAETATIAERVRVVEVLGGDRSLGSSGQLIVVLDVEPEDLEVIAQAAVAGTLTLARTTGLAG